MPTASLQQVPDHPHSAARSTPPIRPPRAGRALDTATRAAMEPRFGRDLSHVRIHADAAAADSVRTLGVVAYTVGHDVTFGAGRYQPGTAMGQRLIAHELAHVVQQDRPTGVGPADAAAESRARLAADTVTRGGIVPPALVGRAPLGMAADDGKDPPGSESPPAGGAGTMGGRLKISAQIVDDLRKRGLLNPELAAMIDSGQILLEPAPSATTTAAGGAAGSGGTRKSFATELNTLPFRPMTFGAGATAAPGLGGGVAAPLPTSRVVGGYLDPVVGYVQPQVVNWSPTTSVPASQNWLTKLAPDLKASFKLSEGLTIGGYSRPGVSTTIWVTGITQKLGQTKGGLAGQVEVGWTGSLGFQLSRARWYLHGEVDPEGKWGFTLSFPSESPMPVLPWITSIFNEGAVALEGFTDIARGGLPTDFGPVMKKASPHVDRMKNAIDAAKGIADADPRLSVSLMVGSGPGPGVTPAEKPSGIFVGGTLMISF